MNLIIEGLGGMCPVQGWGTLDGEMFYFRYRHDSAQLTVGPPDPQFPDMPTARLYAEISDVTGDLDRGWLDTEESVALIHRLIGMLKPVEDWDSTYQDRLIATVDALVALHEANERKEDTREDL